MEYRTLSQLMDAHPKLFKGKLPRVPSENPCGWGKIVHELCAQMESELDDAELRKIRIEQIKEKFGALRFYYSARLSKERLLHLRALVAVAEERSKQTCHACGQPAELATNGDWLSTYCQACLAQPMNARYQPLDFE